MENFKDKKFSKERFEEFIDAIWEHKTKQEEEIKRLKRREKDIRENYHLIPISLTYKNHQLEENLALKKRLKDIEENYHLIPISLSPNNH